MILEAIVTTLGPDGSLNVAPMGPRVDEGLSRFELQPYSTSQTYRNLKTHGEGVIHVVDDVWLLARAAVGSVEPPTFPASRVKGRVLQDACRYYEFRVTGMDESGQRIRIETEVLATGRLRDFFGFNRAKHAVVEAAILATRTAFLPREDILSEFERLAVLVQKTGGQQEYQAFAFLQDFVARQPPAAGNKNDDWSPESKNPPVGTSLGGAE
ncbi:MAG: DUF447 family protein [Planctomycetes bacterium]|nr:DUF447 family protein [Planctomycetota bacterium]